jgi:hypothetical protein
MWALAFSAAASKGTNLEKPRDHRLIGELFMNYCCPDFHANMADLLDHQGISNGNK